MRGFKKKKRPPYLLYTLGVMCKGSLAPPQQKDLVRKVGIYRWFWNIRDSKRKYPGSCPCSDLERVWFWAELFGIPGHSACYWELGFMPKPVHLPLHCHSLSQLRDPERMSGGHHCLHHLSTSAHQTYLPTPLLMLYWPSLKLHRFFCEWIWHFCFLEYWE